MKETRVVKSTQSRRELLHLAGVGATVSLVETSGIFRHHAQAAAPVSHQRSNKAEFELGLASYTLRELDLDDTVVTAKRLALRHIAFKSFHLPLESSREYIEQVARKVKEAGLDLYGASVVYMNNESQVEQAFNYAAAAGMRVIIGVPRPNLLPLVESKVKQYDIKVAIHNHGPGDKVYPLPETVYEKVRGLDERIGLCIDIGHTTRAGGDPSACIREFADRLYDVHVKDVSAATPTGRDVEVGRGVIAIPEILRTLVAINYSGVVAFEYEKDAQDPVPGLAESVGFVRGVLATII